MNLYINIALGAALILTVFTAVSMAGHLWVRVPYVPTRRVVAKEMVKLAGLKAGDRVYDIGAGDGRLLTEAKKACPGITAAGYEFVPSVWLWGWIRAKLTGVQVSLKLGNALNASYRDADVIFIYLFPEVLAKLEPIFNVQLKPGTRVISHAFKFPVRLPKAEKVVRAGRDRNILVYEW